MKLKNLFAIGVIAFTLTGCAPSGNPSTAGGSSLVTVYKNESCGCCNSWVEHLRQNGFRVDARDIDNLGPVKDRVGVPIGMGACHTAEVGGYFIEGHVPAADIKRLLAEHPDANVIMHLTKVNKSIY